MKRYVYNNDGTVVEVTNGKVLPSEPKVSHHVMPDIKPYTSMVTGEVINSRSRHKEHLRERGLVEVGNEVPYLLKNIRRPEPPPGLHDAIMKAAYKHGILK